MNWLEAPECSNNFNKAMLARHPSSGQWFLQGKPYSAWKTQQNSFLWLHGIPGCGKTILSSAIIDDLKNNACFPTLLYFYFDFTDKTKQSFENAIRSLISQLYNKNKQLQKYLDSLYFLCNIGKQQPSLETLHKTLLNMIQQAGEVGVIFDALDECLKRNEPYWGLLPWIQGFQNSQMNCHILITSRPEQDIESAIKNRAREQDIISIQSALIEDDINSYIHAKVREDGRLKRWESRPDIQEEIETTLRQKADGM